MAASRGSLAVPIALDVAVVLIIALRFLARRIQHVDVGIDDYAIIPAGLLAISIGVLNCVGLATVSGSLGMEGYALSERIVIYTKCQLAIHAMAVLTLMFSKQSVLSLYYRIFRSRTFSRLTLVLMVVNAAWGIAFFLATLLACMPIDAYWDATARAAGHCYSPVPVYYGIAVSDVVMNIIILVAPQPIIWKLQMPKTQRFAVSGIVVIGTFTVGLTVARVYCFLEARNGGVFPDDFMAAGFYSPSDVNRPSFWMHIESTAMVISVCLPTMRIIFLEMAAKRVRSLRSFASKLSTRGSTEATKQSTSLSRSRSTRNYTELDNLPPASGTPEYSCEAGRASEVDQSIRFAHHRDSKSGILVSKTIHQATE